MQYVNFRISLAAVALIFLETACSRHDVPPPAPLSPLPSAAQLAWHDMEMNAFVHFTINTFTGKEWGYGDESEKLFNPSQYNPEQWVSVLKEAGFRGVILTCKHHDGFCLWPSAYTDHSLKKSPFKNGSGNIVDDVYQACKKAGLKFGIYLSPWDRHQETYGTPAYVEYYRHQLDELFTRYPDVFEMWFDGANGGDGYYGGKREKRKINGRTYYDWPTTLDQVRRYNPSIIFFSDAGPGVRWVGNENGMVNETNWNTITADTLYAGKGGIEKLLGTGSELGNQWIPAECDVSIRPGWFYHAEEDSLVKSPEKLFEIYLASVGRGSLLLLNVPPDRRGLIHENDVKALQGFRQLLDQEFKTNLATSADVKASATRGDSERFGAKNLTDGIDSTYWTVDDEVKQASAELRFNAPKLVKYVVLKEHLPLGQRVKSFTVEAFQQGAWTTVASGTTIGHKRILKINPTTTDALRISITDARACPVLSAIEVY